MFPLPLLATPMLYCLARDIMNPRRDHITENILVLQYILGTSVCTGRRLDRIRNALKV